MNKGNKAWNKDTSNKGNQHNTNKQLSENQNKSSHLDQQDFSSNSREGRHDATQREMGKDYKGHQDQRNFSRDGQKYNNQNTSRSDKEGSKKIDHEKRKAG